MEENQVKQSKNPFKSENIKIVVSIIIAITVFIVLPIIVYISDIYEEEKKIEYEELLKNTATDISIYSEYSASLCNKICDTWYSAILSLGKKDFNIEIANLENSLDNVGFYDKLADNKDNIEKNMKILHDDFFKEYEEEYNLLVDMYEDYCNLYDHSVNVVGNYKSYNSEYDKLYDNFKVSYNKIKKLVPEVENININPLEEIEGEINNTLKNSFSEDKIKELGKEIEEQLNPLLSYNLEFNKIVQNGEEVDLVYDFSPDKISVSFIYDYSYHLKSVIIMDNNLKEYIGIDYMNICDAICELEDFYYTSLQKDKAFIAMTTPRNLNTQFTEVGMTEIFSTYIERNEADTNNVFSVIINIKN